MQPQQPANAPIAPQPQRPAQVQTPQPPQSPQVQPPLQEVLQTLKLTEVFPIYGSEQQAVQSFVTPA